MRCLLISSQHHPSHGGIGAYIARFVAAATNAGWQVELITRPSDVHPPGARIHEITTHDMQPRFAERVPNLRELQRVRPYRYALWSQAVAAKLRTMQQGFDYVEFVDCQAEGHASLASKDIRDKFAGVPMIIHAHTPMFVEEEINGADMNRFGRHIYHEWERQALRLANGVIATSKLLLQRLTKVHRSLVIPYPIDAVTHSVDYSEHELPKIGKDTIEQITLIGSVQPRKGVDVWAQSLNEVFRRRPNARAVLIGPDTPTAAHNRSMAAYVQGIIKPEYASRFRWLGNTPHNFVQEMILASSVVVVPSMFDSFSFVAAEALIHGVPVIVSDQVGISEHVIDLATFPVSNVHALVKQQLAILSEPVVARRKALHHRNQLLTFCSAAKHLQQRVEFIASVKASMLSSSLMPVCNESADNIDAFISDVELAERQWSANSNVAS